MKLKIEIVDKRTGAKFEVKEIKMNDGEVTHIKHDHYWERIENYKLDVIKVDLD